VLNWVETGHAPELLAAWVCCAGDRELVILQRSAVIYSAAVRDAVTGEVLVHLDERFQSWEQAALWAEAQLGGDD